MKHPITIQPSAARGSEDGDVSAEAGGFGNAQDDQLTSTLLG